MVYVSRPGSGPGAYTTDGGHVSFFSLGQWEKKENISAAAKSQSLYLNFPGPGKLVVFMA